MRRSISIVWRFISRPALIGFAALWAIGCPSPAMAQDAKEIRVGIIGLDTSHAIAFTKLLNAKDAPAELAGCRVVAVYPKGSPDIETSVSRVPQYTEDIKQLGVTICPSIDAMLEQVDAVLLETNDGRPHLEQIRPVLAAKKPVFVDKPAAGSLADVLAIYREAAAANVPVFSSSSLRYTPGAQEIRNGAIGKVWGCDAFSPCSLESTHPDLFWYGIHGVESLFTVMGTGCKTVVRSSTADTDVVVGTWADGRIGTFRGIRSGHRGYGGTAFGSTANRPIGDYAGYRPLVVEIVKFFRTGKPPVSSAETIEIYAFMEAADESKRRGGAPVDVAEVLKKAQGGRTKQ
ncbi:Gfo/Idh/MocA family protein [Planctomycetota bacterium]